MEKPEPPPHVVAPPPPPQGSTEEAVRARSQLAAMVRKNDEVLLALQLRQSSDDRTIMKALAKVRDLFELLRQAGCSIVQATRAEELMELALEAPDVRPPKRSPLRYFYGAAGVIVLLILVFVAITVLEVTQSSVGWEVGQCSITLFHNQTCFQEGGKCYVEVAVRSGTVFMSKNPWALPIAHVGARGEFTRYEGDAFRCCNDAQGQVGSCCDLVSGGVQQKSAETFCDAFGLLGRTDWRGDRCGMGSWPCLFTVNLELQTVDELQLFSPPDVSSYIVIIVVLVLILVIGSAVRLLQVFNIRCDCSALFQVTQDEDADLYDPDDPHSDWGQVVQEAAQEEALKKRQANCRGRIKKAVAQIGDKWKRLKSCIKRGDLKKQPETPRGEARIRRVNSKISQGRAPSKSSLTRSSSKLSRGSRGRSPSKGQGSLVRGASKISLGAESDAQPEAPEDVVQDTKAKQPKPEAPRASAAMGQDVAELAQEEPKRIAASFPPGFVWHGDIKDPQLADSSLEKYLKWEATGKELEDVQEQDIHPGFVAGNLGGIARMARQQHQSLLLPIVEPMSTSSARVHSYSTNTLYYSCSTLREGRRKKRKRGAIKGSGKPTARSLDTPQKWMWAGQGEPSRRQLPIENGPRFSTVKVPGAQAHILSLE